MTKASLIGMMVALLAGGVWWFHGEGFSLRRAAAPVPAELRGHKPSELAPPIPHAPPSPKADRVDAVAARVKIEGIYLLEKVGNRKDLELHADSAVIYQGQDLIYLRNLQASFYPESGQLMRLKADSGKVDNLTKDMEISGNVKVMRGDGISMMTETLHWDNSKREIRTQDPVRVHGDRLEVTGRGLVSKVDGDSLELKGPVKALVWQGQGSGK